MVYELATEDIHSPRLAVLQAAFQYLHKQPTDGTRYAIADTPFTSSFVAQIVGLACSLGERIGHRM